MKKSAFVLTFLFIVLFFSCEKNPGEPEPLQVKDKKSALICVIENNQSVGGESIELAFDLFKGSVLPVFAEFFQIDKKLMKDMTLAQVIDVYGEAWQINEIEKIANEHYDEFVALTDSTAIRSMLLDTITKLSENGYCIDMIFNLHGNSSGFSLDDQFCLIDDFINNLEQNNIQIRSLYQTCCYGFEMIKEWEAYGLTAVNGTKKVNSFALFSPIYFLKEWIAGNSFQDSVESAYSLEISQISSYSSYLPVEQFFLTDDNKVNSRQYVGGSNPKLIWNEF